MQSTVKRSTNIQKSARVMQVESMFDVPPSESSVLEWDVSLDLPTDWNVGLIVGSSGSGKTTIATELFGKHLITGYEWDNQSTILDGFPKGQSISEITGLLCSVGLGSPVSWLRPFSVLSNGEKFRATMARAIAENSDLIVVDEFTSVIDRQIAQVASHTVQKTIRARNSRFVAISCHYDIIDWLQPDWIYQPHGNQFQRRLLRQRPKFELEIYSVGRAAWQLFKPYHYMSASLASSAHCFGGFINGECIAFCSYVHFPHRLKKNIKQTHRIVVHPEFQGLGIGLRMANWMGQCLADKGDRLFLVTAHPAMIGALAKSPRWQHERTMAGNGKGGSSMTKLRRHQKLFSAQRIASSFSFRPGKSPTLT
jgi:ABC-type dipeptide/oligopeptide/nickel transport system ATPase subunit